ncbi:uncharacterized protein EV422DRAFT_225253 [Fimicolochytrium jonesii]|uniref:uncharacterized protein n=1 Tax=Fimicolochytrium jonesii TaxID=1396493 RepID=UPI0022FEC1CB|nr:uncharacterized protein EV422DRAFT_225253 [Fimicolochytrium jonesii]KAI8817444.1 hypothetical protein EV422DRAFT_225253 [Fimicolochytrium jonesii]
MPAETYGKRYLTRSESMALRNLSPNSSEGATSARQSYGGGAVAPVDINEELEKGQLERDGTDEEMPEEQQDEEYHHDEETTSEEHPPRPTLTTADFFPPGAHILNRTIHLEFPDDVWVDSSMIFTQSPYNDEEVIMHVMLPLTFDGVPEPEECAWPGCEEATATPDDHNLLVSREGVKVRVLVPTDDNGWEGPDEELLETLNELRRPVPALAER